MIHIRDIHSCLRFIALDGTDLCELLHPLRESEGGGIAAGIPYSIAHASLPAGARSSLHRLRTSSEVYYILEGEGLVEIDGEAAAVKAGQAIIIPRGSWQHIKNTGDMDLKFLCIVYPYWNADDEELLEDDRRGKKRC